ncbi:hypothetical protein Caci_3254 [Catenulispora acidiphila DSM 44928]|uniref:Beta-ketoacyl synthase N-terminal domain-containing protein n=1 Tax=Catenulispora acidiphila (strain DSM 44928 / JCM 14897 / NBRC 102108 / NRRL B-24433 / ID139908) TaxID=479433 RepID=C7Q6F5_CATAD|nr:hypothetical protein [Catenulispora acidiphila]ACU72161.1 hypothetical protein Caci_3254 [Catenulispora acidiphila DSM 44928]
MNQTTEALATVPEQKAPAGASQNLPTDLTDLTGTPRRATAAISAATEDEAAAAGLAIRAEARWPESGLDDAAPALPGFIVSSFSPIAAETAARCLSRRAAHAPENETKAFEDPETSEARAQAQAHTPVTAILITTARGDRESASHVARTVAANGLLGPLLFFQSVPNAVAGHIAARWKLTGPVVCLADPASALETAALLIEDGDADEALLVRIEQNPSGPDQAHAVLLAALTAHPAPSPAPQAKAPAPTTPGARP